MLTLKLRDTASGRTSVEECSSVESVPDGDGSTRLVVRDAVGGTKEVRLGDGHEFDVAYVETDRGSTTHAIGNVHGGRRAR